MMTKQRKLRLRQKIQASRGRLMEAHPFFGLLLMYLKFVAVPEMKKMSTNGRCIYFSPDFLDKLYDHELDLLLCHQIMHIINGHIWRPYDRKGDDYHYVCDVFVNTLLLTEYDFTQGRYPHLGYVHIKKLGDGVDPLEMSPENMFRALPYSLYQLEEPLRNKFLMDNDLWWDQKEDSGRFGEMILDLPELDGILKEGAEVFGGDEDLSQEWQGRVASTVNTMETSKNNDDMAGNVPDFVQRMVQKMKPSTVDWKKKLNNFIQERICDYSFSPPDRRFSDTEFFLPDFNEKDFVCKEILFMVDTSCSVTDAELAAVYSEIRGAIEQFGGKLTGKLGFFDTEVTPPLPFETVADLMEILPYGGGGTDFKVIFAYIRRNCAEELPACIVIFTDGKGPYPAEAETMGIPVLWMINNLEITPPWGTTTRILPAPAGK